MVFNPKVRYRITGYIDPCWSKSKQKKMVSWFRRELRIHLYKIIPVGYRRRVTIRRVPDEGYGGYWLFCDYRPVKAA